MGPEKVITGEFEHNNQPGGEVSKRPVHMIYLVDVSGSMNESGKISAANQAIRETIPHLINLQNENPHATILVRVIAFADSTQWIVSQPTPIQDFTWNDLTANGTTAMGKACEEVAEKLSGPDMGDRGFSPTLIMISDGHPTDSVTSGINKINSVPWGRKSIRMAIAIGKDADHDVLQQFIGDSEITPIQANNPEALKEAVRLVSTVANKQSSVPNSIPNGCHNPAWDMVQAQVDGVSNVSDVW